MKRLTILCAALTAAMFMNMSAYAGTSEVAAEVSAGTVCLPGADLTDVMGCGSISVISIRKLRIQNIT